MVYQNTYEWRVIQVGQLVLMPDGQRIAFRQHQPTSVLFWPSNEKPSQKNLVLTYPYFSNRNYEDASKTLSDIGLSIRDIGYVFCTHPHADHLPHLPQSINWNSKINILTRCDYQLLKGIKIVNYPGHHPELEGLIFISQDNKVIGIVGDAVLDEEWLRAWKYYWPNGYNKEEIIQTWKSIVNIICSVDIIVPGHGYPIRISNDLINNLISKFSNAEYFDQCLELIPALKQRLQL